MAGQGRLQPAAERRAVDGRDHRLGAILQRLQHRREADLPRLLPGCELAELLDVGPGREVATRAAEGDGLGAVVAPQLAQGRHPRLGDARPQRVDGRVIDRYDADRAVLRPLHQLTHGFAPDTWDRFLWRPASRRRRDCRSRYTGLPAFRAAAR